MNGEAGGVGEIIDDSVLGSGRSSPCSDAIWTGRADSVSTIVIGKSTDLTVVELHFDVLGSITRDQSPIEQHLPLVQALISLEEQVPQELLQKFLELATDKENVC